MQRVAGLYGWIRVLPPDGIAEPYTYDYEKSVILNDCYNKSTSHCKFKGRESSIAPNRHLQAWIQTAHNATNPAHLNWTVLPGKTYRLRISSEAILYGLSFHIEGHNLTVVEADGRYAEPLAFKNLFISPGETYSVLIKADQDPSRNYWITPLLARAPLPRPLPVSTCSITSPTIRSRSRPQIHPPARFGMTSHRNWHRAWHQSPPRLRPHSTAQSRLSDCVTHHAEQD
ncbi:hypothetical protein BT93_I0300 [Corymbia citriodora subsp. variegata]|nr:hypothetical protein BT93_I0300 [Corymbia citriodora subsp. variegata]